MTIKGIPSWISRGKQYHTNGGAESFAIYEICHHGPISAQVSNVI